MLKVLRNKWKGIKKMISLSRTKHTICTIKGNSERTSNLSEIAVP